MDPRDLKVNEVVIMPKDCCSGGKICRITWIDKNPAGDVIQLKWDVLDPVTLEKVCTDYCTGHAAIFRDIIYYDASKKNNGGVTKIMSSLLDKVKLLTLGEPEKTFRKLGIQDSNGDLTVEGKALYDAWKFKKDQDAFRLEVADPLLKEMEDEKANCKN